MRAFSKAEGGSFRCTKDPNLNSASTHSHVPATCPYPEQASM